MPKKYLPEYTVLVRWGVQDVVNWLTENGFQDCVKMFREHAIDGEKFFHMQDTDLKKIKCPNKKSKELIKILDKIKIKDDDNVALKKISIGERLGSGRAPLPPTTRAPRVPAPTYNPHPVQAADDDSFSDDFSDFSEEEGPVEEELYEDPEAEPTPPPRSGQRRNQPPTPQVHAPALPKNVRTRPPAPAPVIEPQEDEEYEDPDQAMKVRQMHPGPLPKLPGAPVLPQHRGAATLPHNPTRGLHKALPPPPQDDQEEYEDPDQAMKVRQMHPGPLPKLPGAPVLPQHRGATTLPHNPTRGLHKALPPPPQDDQPVYEETDQIAEDQDLYEEPHEEEAPPPPPSRNTNKTAPINEELYEIPAEELTHIPPSRPNYRLPTPPVEEDNYLEMDAKPTPAQVFLPSSNHLLPSSRAPAVPKSLKAAPIPQPQGGDEDYENPTLEPPAPPRNQRKKSDIVVPPGKNVHHNGRHAKDELDGRPWYFGLINRNETSNLLMKYKEDGMYLIRKSVKEASKPFTLALYYKGTIFNLQITLTGAGYVLGTADKHVFKALDEMLEFFGKHFLVLQAGAGETQLRRPVPK